MKKMILLIAGLMIMVAVKAQDFYVSLGVGAGIGTARTYDLYSDLKAYPVGLGKGFAPVLRAGIFVNDFMSVELGVAYRIGINTKVSVNTSYLYGPAASGTTGNIKYSGGMLQLIPAVVIQPDFDLGNVSPYARVGVIIGILSSIKEKYDLTSNNTNTIATFKRTGGLAIGGSAALGCDFDLSDMLAIYAEIYYDALSYAPTKGKYLKYSENGVDQLGTMTTHDKETKYVKDMTDYKPSSDQPSQHLKNSFPFNNIGLNFGVKIKI